MRYDLAKKQHWNEITKMDMQEKTKQLTQDYADFLAEYEAAKARGEFIGTFIAWRHANNRDGIVIEESRSK